MGGITKGYRTAAAAALMLLVAACATPQKMSLLECSKEADREYIARNFAVAETYYEELVKANPMHHEGWFRLGNISAHGNRLNEAAERYEKALKAKPDLAEAWHNLGIVLFRKGVYSLEAAQRYSIPGKPTWNRNRNILDSIRKVPGLLPPQKGLGTFQSERPE